jgi:hypothetical protein
LFRPIAELTQWQLSLLPFATEIRAFTNYAACLTSARRLQHGLQRALRVTRLLQQTDSCMKLPAAAAAANG